MSGREGSEGSDGPERAEPSDGDLERLRQEIQEDYGPEGTDPKSEDIAKEGADEGKEPPGAGAKDDHSGEVAGAQAGDKEATVERISDEDLEKFRQQVIDEYGPEGLGKDTFEGQLHHMALEERERAEASGDPDQAEKDAKVEVASAGSAIDGSMDAAGSDLDKDGQDKPWGVAREFTDSHGNLSESTASTTDVVENYSWNDNQIVVTEVRPVSEDGKDGLGQAVETSDLHGLQADSPLNRPYEIVGAQSVAASPETVSESKSTSPVDSLASTEVGRYNRNDRQLVVTEDDVIRTAVEYVRSTALLLPESEMPSHTKDDVIAVTVARESESWEEYTLYCRHTPGQVRAYVDLRQLDAELHERFKIREVSVHGIEQFGDEYNARGPPGLENTGLALRKGEVFMNVDGREIPLIPVGFRSQEGRAVFDAKIGDTQVKIANGIEGSEVRMSDHSIVTRMRIEHGDLVFSYQRTDHDRHPHQRAVIRMPGEERASRPEGTLSREGRLRVGGIEGGPTTTATLEVDDRLRNAVEGLLTSAANRDRYIRLKGDIAEELVREQIIPQLDMNVIADHPFNNDPAREGSERRGPDLLVKSRSTGGLYLVEVKWWADVDDALEHAEKQASGDFHAHRNYEGMRIDGAFAMVLDWNPNREVVRLHTIRAVPKQGSFGAGLNIG